MQRLLSTVRRACRDCRGTIAPLFAFSVFLVCGAVGLSIDGARVYAAKQRMQTVADAAVLAAARRAMIDGGTDAATEAVQRFLEASGLEREIDLRTVTPDLSAPKRVSLELVGMVPTILMPVLGFSTVEVRAGAVAEFGFTKVEVALALDNTGSMAGAKLAALKSSASRMVDTLLDRAREDGDIRVSLVPFAQYVNVGVENRNASWMNVPADYSTTTEWCRDERPVIGTRNCRMVTTTIYNDGVPSTTTYEQCDYDYGPPVYTCSPVTNTFTWTGCAGSRSYPLNVRDADYATRIPGVLNTQCPSRIQPLTSQRSQLQSAIDAMTATGDTYVPEGLMWGLRTLSPGVPYNESAGERLDSDGNRLSKVLVLMTDGENTRSPNYPDHNGSDASLANRLTTEACDAVKGAQVKIYTIAFNVTSSTIRDLMRACASTPGHYFDAADAGQLDDAMQAIASQIGGLRLVN